MTSKQKKKSGHWSSGPSPTSRETYHSKFPVQQGPLHSCSNSTQSTSFRRSTCKVHCPCYVPSQQLPSEHSTHPHDRRDDRHRDSTYPHDRCGKMVQCCSAVRRTRCGRPPIGGRSGSLSRPRCEGPAPDGEGRCHLTETRGRRELGEHRDRETRRPIGLTPDGENTELEVTVALVISNTLFTIQKHRGQRVSIIRTLRYHLFSQQSEYQIKETKQQKFPQKSTLAGW